MNVLDTNWNAIRKRVILPLWNGKFKSMYESAKLDYADFESLVGEELVKAMVNFNPNKSNLFTYVTNVINKKAVTELRNCTQRDKRRALHTSDSIDEVIGDQNDRYTTMCDNIPYFDEKDKKDYSELSELRVGNFINSLNNNQLRVLILTLLDFDSGDLPCMLNISSGTATQILNSLKDADLTRVLYRRKF